MPYLTQTGLNVRAKVFRGTIAILVLCQFVYLFYSNELPAQSRPPERVAFEVASVKVNKSADPSQMVLQYLPGGRFSATAVPMPLLLAEAYKELGSGRRFSLSPELMKSLGRATMAERYDIEAVAEKDAIPPGASAKLRNDRVRLMLQTLLSERFKLVLHREVTEQPVYALVIAKGGPKLQPASIDERECAAAAAAVGDSGSCHFVAGGMQRQGINGQAVDMSDLATALSGFTDRPVLNQTGLDGLYAVHTTGWVPLRVTPTPPGQSSDGVPSEPSGPTLFTVLEQLGLKLESRKAQVETIVVVHFETPPQYQ